MNIIELIGIIVGSIATILGGVWFMLYKAFNLGKVSHRMEEIEKKTSNADCKTHKESIEKIKEHNLPQRVEQIEKKTLHADCEANNNIIKEIKEERLPQRVEQIEKKTTRLQVKGQRFLNFAAPLFLSSKNSITTSLK